MTRGCMVAMAWGLLFVVACGNDSKPAVPADDEPAGEVLQIEGKVTAEGNADGDETIRALAVGDKVYARDTIVTGDDSSVTIRLFHNNAEWTLGAGKRRELQLSAAWKAPVQAGEDLLSSGEGSQTAAAGRHAEKEAAGTRATAAVEVAAEQEAPPGATPVESKEEVSREAPRRPTRSASRSRDTRKAELAKEVENVAILKELGSSGGDVSNVLGSDDGELDKAFDGAAGLGLKGTGRGGGGTGNGTVGVGTGTIGTGSGAGAGRGYGSGGGAEKKSAPVVRLSLKRVSATGGLGSEIVKRLLRRQSRALQHCYQLAHAKDDKLAGKLAIEFSIDGKGAVTKVSVGGDAKLAGAVRACVTARIRNIRFPASADGAGTSVVAEVVLGAAE